MRFSVKTDDIRKALSGAETQIAKAVTAGMRDASVGLKGDLRDDVTGAGLGQRLANTWRGKAYPESGESMEAAAFVWSKAPKLIDAYDRGATIRSNRGFFLAIPTEYAGRGIGREKVTPGSWERRTGIRLKFIYRRGAPSLLVAEQRARTGKGAQRASSRFARPSPAALKSGRGLTSVVVFILVPQVRVKKRLDINRIAQAWADRVPSLVASHWT